MKSVEWIKISLEFTQRDVQKFKPLRAEVEKVKKQLDLLSKEPDSQSLKMEYLENQSRRNNIRVNGIPESSKESTLTLQIRLSRQDLSRRAIKH